MCKKATIIICLDKAGMQVKNFLHMLSEYEHLERYQLIFAMDQEEEHYFRGFIKKYFLGLDVDYYKTRNIHAKGRVYNKASTLAYGDVLIFMDTNVVLENQCVEELIYALEELDILAVQPLMIKYHAEKVYSTGYVFSGNRSGQALENREIDEEIVNQSSVRNALALSMLAINRFAFEELQGFNEQIPCEYIGRDLTERITGLGYQNYYNHKARVYYMESGQTKNYSELEETSGTLKIENLILEQMSRYLRDGKYAVFNFSEIGYVREFIYRLGVRTVMYRDYNQWSNHNRIELEEIIPLSMVDLEYNSLYVVNNFCQIKDNPQWFKRRRNYQDLVVDLSGNVICISDYWKESGKVCI